MEYPDLHIHSNYSDGKLSLDSIIDYATQINLKAISITDHDTIEGIQNITGKHEDCSLEILPGIELSTFFKDNEVHVLGYNYDINDKGFIKNIKELQSQRLDRAIKIIHNLNNIGIPITLQDLNSICESNSYGRPHFAQIIVNKGFANNLNEAFQKYLIPGKPGFVPRFKLPSKNAVDIIHKAGGLAVLAHPGLIKNQELIKDILKLPFDGIEVYHSKHISNMVREYYRLAKDNNLLITGGSDCHESDTSKKPFIGTVKIPYEYVEQLKKKGSERNGL